MDICLSTQPKKKKKRRRKNINSPTPIKRTLTNSADTDQTHLHYWSLNCIELAVNVKYPSNRMRLEDSPFGINKLIKAVVGQMMVSEVQLKCL